MLVSLSGPFPSSIGLDSCHDVDETYIFDSLEPTPYSCLNLNSSSVSSHVIYTSKRKLIIISLLLDVKEIISSIQQVGLPKIRLRFNKISTKINTKIYLLAMYPREYLCRIKTAFLIVWNRLRCRKPLTCFCIMIPHALNLSALSFSM